MTLAVVDGFGLTLAIAGTLICGLGSSLIALLCWVSTRLVRAVDRLTERVESVEIEQTRIVTSMKIKDDQ
jgi:hypothetical protein